MAARRCLRASSNNDRSSDPTAVEKGALGGIAPVFDQPEELLVARIDFLGKVVARADLGNDVPADIEKSLQQGVVKFQNFDRAFAAQLPERPRVIGVELGE